jgi:hypothetical protein
MRRASSRGGRRASASQMHLASCAAGCARCSARHRRSSAARMHAAPVRCCRRPPADRQSLRSVLRRATVRCVARCAAPAPRHAALRARARLPVEWQRPARVAAATGAERRAGKLTSAPGSAATPPAQPRGRRWSQQTPGCAAMHARVPSEASAAAPAPREALAPRGQRRFTARHAPSAALPAASLLAPHRLRRLRTAARCWSAAVARLRRHWQLSCGTPAAHSAAAAPAAAARPGAKWRARAAWHHCRPCARLARGLGYACQRSTEQIWYRSRRLTHAASCAAAGSRSAQAAAAGARQSRRPLRSCAARHRRRCAAGSSVDWHPRSQRAALPARLQPRARAPAQPRARAPRRCMLPAACTQQRRKSCAG